VRRISALDGVPQELDLCIRAARLLQRMRLQVGCGHRAGETYPYGVFGGGSSDAATTLIALNNLWGLGLSRERLMEIGLSLGADVRYLCSVKTLMQKA